MVSPYNFWHSSKRLKSSLHFLPVTSFWWAMSTNNPLLMEKCKPGNEGCPFFVFSFLITINLQPKLCCLYSFFEFMCKVNRLQLPVDGYFLSKNDFQKR